MVFLTFLLKNLVVGQNFFGVRIGNPEYDQYIIANVLVKAAEEVNAATSSTDTGIQLWRWIETPFYRKIKTNILTIERLSSWFSFRIFCFTMNRSCRHHCQLPICTLSTAAMMLTLMFFIWSTLRITFLEQGRSVLYTETHGNEPTQAPVHSGYLAPRREDNGSKGSRDNERRHDSCRNRYSECHPISLI